MLPGYLFIIAHVRRRIMGGRGARPYILLIVKHEHEHEQKHKHKHIKNCKKTREHARDSVDALVLL